MRNTLPNANGIALLGTRPLAAERAVELHARITEESLVALPTPPRRFHSDAHDNTNSLLDGGIPAWNWGPAAGDQPGVPNPELRARVVPDDSRSTSPGPSSAVVMGAHIPNLLEKGAMSRLEPLERVDGSRGNQHGVVGQ
jgi:hypothetical protein